MTFCISHTAMAFFSVWNEVALYSLMRESLKELYSRKGFSGEIPGAYVDRKDSLVRFPVHMLIERLLWRDSRCVC